MTYSPLNHSQDYKIMNDTFIVKVQVEKLDFYTSKNIMNICFNLIEEKSARKLALDLSNVSDITTSGIGSLLSIYHCAINKEARFSVFNVTDPVLDIMKKTMVNTVINIVSNEESALSLI